MYMKRTESSQHSFTALPFAETPLNINDSADHSMQFYEISTPFMITYESCDEENDYMEITQFSPFEHTAPFCLKLHFSTLSEELHSFITSDRPLHRHSFLEIMYVMSGSVTNKVENQLFTYTAGQCCVMNKNIRHSEYFTGHFQAMFFMLRDDFIQEIYEDHLHYLESSASSKHPFFQMYLEDQKEDSLFSKIYLDYFPLISSEKSDEYVSAFFTLMQESALSQTPGTAYIAAGLFAQFLHHLNDASLFRVSQIQSDASSSEYLFAKIVNIMKSSHGRCSRNELSTQLHYNSEYLNRIVKKYTGKSILEYGQSIYLEEARKMLIETDRSISDIITELGFSNRSHFYKLFEKQYGETPKQCREKTNT